MRSWITPALCLWAAAAAAQDFPGDVRGAVRDTTGIVQGASVTLADEHTNLARRTESNVAGEFAFANVLPGTYRLTVARDGYKTHERAGLRVSARASLALAIELAVGSVSETIMVRADASVAEAAGASVQSLIDRRALERLPSAGRNIFITSTLTPMAIATGDSRFVRQQDQSNSSLISLGGGPRRNNAYVLDGVPIVDILNRATIIPSFEAAEEMRVQVSPYDASVGRTSGGVFNTVARSGTNQWRGSGQYQTRPNWAQSETFFAAKTRLAAAPTYHHLFGGGAGGPIVRDRAFVWLSTEGYRSRSSRSAVLVLPTEAERRGDFSQSGVTIFDPLTTRPSAGGAFVRDAFPGNRIPESRLNPVARALLQYLPLPTSGKTRPAVADLVDAADQVTGKLTAKLTNRWLSSGLYAWYGSAEPDPRYFGSPIFTNGADPGEGALIRRVHTLALNQTWMTGRAAVQARYGFNAFLDDNRPASFDPAGLGFDPAFLRQVDKPKFPSIGVSGYGSAYGFLGDRTQSTARYRSHVASVSVSTLKGRHAITAGGEWRRNGVSFLNHGGLGGYGFSRDFTLGPDPNQPAAATGDAFASFLLGYPSGGGIGVSSPISVDMTYAGGFVQDDVRVISALTVSLGLRYEFEQGLRERDNRMIAGWAFDEPFPVQVAGVRPDGTPLALTGGVTYAGVDGASAHQGSPGRAQFGPRVGAAYAVNARTVIRGGYGLFWAPAQGIAADEVGSGTTGYNRSTPYVATGANPLIPCDECSLTSPFPRGFAQPTGNSLGRLTGVGGTVFFADPTTHLAHFHRYSIGVERELPSRTVVSATYVGMLGRDLSGSAGGAPLNINQLPRSAMALGTALQEAVPNPFFGSPLAVGILAMPTVARGQLLRPYPQFDTVYMTRAAVAQSRYDALVLAAERRPAGRWSAQVNYTWSRMRDSQYGESNFFSGGSGIIDNHDVAGEYGLSVLDTPHRVNVTGIVELPFRVTVSATGTYQSGFPITVHQSPNNSNLFGSGQRPNTVPGVNPVLTGDPEDHFDPACACIRWLNPAAWSQAAPFTFGDAPRADTRARTPIRRNWDLAVEKSQQVGGRTLSLRAEIVNVFNFADLRGPIVTFGAATFGEIREASGFPRMLQLSARVTW